MKLLNLSHTINGLKTEGASGLGFRLRLFSVAAAQQLPNLKTSGILRRVGRLPSISTSSTKVTGLSELTQVLQTSLETRNKLSLIFRRLKRLRFTRDGFARVLRSDFICVYGS